MNPEQKYAEGKWKVCFSHFMDFLRLLNKCMVQSPSPTSEKSKLRNGFENSDVYLYTQWTLYVALIEDTMSEYDALYWPIAQEFLTRLCFTSEFEHTSMSPLMRAQHYRNPYLEGLAILPRSKRWNLTAAGVRNVLQEYGEFSCVADMLQPKSANTAQRATVIIDPVST